MKLAAIIAVCLLTCWPAHGAPATQPATGVPAVGAAAPELSLDTLDGKRVVLTELVTTGPVVLLELRGWVGYQCPLCTKQVHDFVVQADAFKQAGARVVLVYPGAGDGLKAHAEEFVSGKGLPADFLFALDPGMKFVHDWGLRWDKPNETAYPATFVIDPAGIVRFAKVSQSHGGRATAKEVLAALKGIH